MKFLIVFASTEGQTRKIAQFAFDRLTASGHSVAMFPASEAGDVAPGSYDGAILGASLHAGRYQSEFISFVTEHAETLGSIPTLFLSVSLAAAGDDTEDWTSLRNIAAAMAKDTGWSPDSTEHVAGAFKFSDYDFFRYWAMRWIESKKDPAAEPGTDREYTDWEALEAVLDAWSDRIA